MLLISTGLNKTALKYVKQNLIEIHEEMLPNMIINLFIISLTEMEILCF